MEPTEQQIKNSILDYIRLHPLDGFAWSHYNGAIYDHRLGFCRKRSKYYLNGISDICGIWKGKPLFIEVKKKGGIISADQRRFLNMANHHGAIADVVFSLDEAIKILHS